MCVCDIILYLSFRIKKQIVKITVIFLDGRQNFLGSGISL
jgi:hypothetical protein